MSSRPIELRLLQTFVVVAREGNVSRAAEKLFLSQPAVSLQLKELARYTGLDLFTRTASGMVLTREGGALLAHAERVLEGAADFSVAAQRLARGVRGRLRIGTILDPEFTRLGAFLHELVNQAPEIEPELQHGTSGSMLARAVKPSMHKGSTAIAITASFTSRLSIFLPTYSGVRPTIRPATKMARMQ